MDLTKLSDDDLVALKSGDLTKLSDQGLQMLREDRMRVDAPGVDHGPLDTIGDYFTRALDYPSGWARTGVAAAQGEVKKQKTGDASGIPTEEDVMNTLKGKAPLMNEYNRRLGIPQGGNLSDVLPGVYAKPGDTSAPWYQPTKGGLLDPTARGGGSMVEDMVLTPSVLLKSAQMLKEGLAGAKTAEELRAAASAARAAEATQMAKTPLQTLPGNVAAVAKSAATGNLLNDASQAAGQFMYRQPFKQADIAAMTEGKGAHAVSDIALKNGVYGATQSGLEAQLKSIAKKSSNAASGLEDDFVSQGGGPIPTQPVLQGTMDRAFDDANAESNPRVRAGTAVYNELSKTAEQSPTMDLDRLVRYKRDQQSIADTMNQYNQPMVAPDPTGNSKFEGPLRQKLAGDATRTIENAMDAQQPGMGGRYYQNNQTFGAIKSGLPGSNKASIGEMLRAAVPSVADAPFIIGGGALGNMVHHTPEGMLYGYLAGKAATSPLGLTGIGLNLNRAGKYGLVDPAVREALDQRYRLGGTSPWSLLASPK